MSEFVIEVAVGKTVRLPTAGKYCDRDIVVRVIPDEPALTKLSAPAIWLETIADESEENTPAILGVAVLGRTILGEYGGTLPKLDTPVISLETENDSEELPKLDTPVISLETENDSEELPKLDTPVISLETETQLITFIIEGDTFQAEEGMTWGEWVDSEYNIDGYAIDSSDNSIFLDEYWVASDEQWDWVYASDVIIAGHVYYQSL